MPSALIRAARLHAHGEPLAVDDVTLSEPGEGEVRVELEFAGINPIDRYIAEGRVAPDGPLPRTLGGEAAGSLDGRAVLVAGAGLGAVRDGLWAQAAIVPRDAVVDLPAGVATRPAAAMGIAGLTAFKCARELASLSAEDRVLVLGASGGVGSIIVSLAHAAGATVWGQTGSADKTAGVQAQGADRVIVADAGELAGKLRELEPTVVFDPLAGPFVAPVIEALTPGGRLVSFGTSAGPEVTFNMQQLYRKNLTVYGYAGLILSPAERRQGIEAALAALADGALTVRIDSELALDEINAGFQRIVDRDVQGKLVLALR